MRDDQEAPYTHVDGDEDFLASQDTGPETDLGGALAVIVALAFLVGLLVYVFTR